ERKFEKEKILKLSIDDKIVYTVDLLPKVQLITSENEREKGIKKIETKPKEYEVRRDKFEDIIDLLDWQKIYQEVCYFKTQRGYWNLIFDIETLKEVLQSSEYKLLCSPEIFEPKSISDIKKLEDIAVLVIEKYLDLFYKKEWRKFETEELQYCKLSQSPPSSFFKDKQGYVVQIEKKNENLIENIKKLAQDLNKILDEENGLLPRIYFDRSLYVPILLESEKVDKISPPGLVKSEEK
ncbi:MAG: restriction endonuclease subunit R, partial [Candidatus Hydrothermales bacterium]